MLPAGLVAAAADLVARTVAVGARGPVARADITGGLGWLRAGPSEVCRGVAAAMIVSPTAVFSTGRSPTQTMPVPTLVAPAQISEATAVPIQRLATPTSCQ